MDSRKRGSGIGSFGVLLLLLALPVRAAKPQVAPPLIQLQGSEADCTRSGFVPFGGLVCALGQLRERTVTILRNGRAVSVVTEAEFGTDLPTRITPARSTLRDGQLLARQIERLNEYLAGILIEVRRGECDPFILPPGATRIPGEFASYTVFWYAPDGRRSSVPFGTEFSRKCPPEILELFETLLRFGDSIR